jgi:hypothetical protein
MGEVGKGLLDRTAMQSAQPSLIRRRGFLPIHNWLHRLEVDRPIVYGLAGRIWSFLSAPVTVVLITSRFTRELQGYYYTFNSLLGLQVFVELGLSTVVVQFASHEWSKLEWDPKVGLSGDAGALSRLVSLGRVAMRWFVIAAAIVAVGLGGGGYVFFSQTPSHGITWAAPWFALCVACAANLCLTPVFALLEGCNQVSSVYGYRSVQAVVSSIAIWSAIFFGAGLWAAPVCLGATFVWAVAFLWRYRRFLKPFVVGASLSGPRIHWRSEMLPMQWRVAVSYLSGYFTYSVFTPLMFHYQGAAVAGQMGMTLAVVSAIGSMGSIWSMSKAPRFGMLIARKAWGELDRLFHRVAIASQVVLACGATVVWLAIYGLYASNHRLAERFLPPWPAAFLVVGVVASNFCTPMGVYLRAHKREPYMTLSLVLGLLTGLVAWILSSQHVGAAGVAAGYMAVSLLVGLPAGLLIFRYCRVRWHQEDPAMNVEGLHRAPDRALVGPNSMVARSIPPS